MYRAIISLHLPTVNDHMIAKATVCVFRGGEIFRFLNGMEGSNARQKGSGTPENEFAAALLCGFYALGINNALTERTNPLGMTFFLPG